MYLDFITAFQFAAICWLLACGIDGYARKRDADMENWRQYKLDHPDYDDFDDFV